MGRSAAAVGALLGLCAVALPASARAQPAQGPALNWVRLSGAESCIAPVELARRVEARLGRPVFVRASDAIIVIEGRVEPDPAGGYHSVIRVSDPDGTLYGSRELRVPNADCHALDELTALILTITIRHDGAGGIELPDAIAAQLDALFAAEPSVLDPAELPAASVHTASPSSESTVARTSAPPPAAGAPGLRLQVEAGFALGTGLQPAATLAPLLRVRLARAELGSLALAGSYGLTQNTRAAGATTGVLETQALQLGLGACLAVSRWSVAELALCVDARLGQLRVAAHSFNVDNASTRKLWLEVAAAASVHAHLFGPSYLHFRLGVPWRLIRPRFQYHDDRAQPRDALEVAHVGLDLELGVGVEF